MNFIRTYDNERYRSGVAREVMDRPNMVPKFLSKPEKEEIYIRKFCKILLFYKKNSKFSYVSRPSVYEIFVKFLLEMYIFEGNNENSIEKFKFIIKLNESHTFSSFKFLILAVFKWWPCGLSFKIYPC